MFTGVYCSASVTDTHTVIQTDHTHTRQYQGRVGTSLSMNLHWDAQLCEDPSGSMNSQRGPGVIQ